MSSISVALPSIGRELEASAVELGLTMTAYVLANAMLLLPIGRFADIYGRRKIFISGACVVALATFGLGLVGSMTSFLLLRFMQGIGAAMIISTSLAILTVVFPPERRGRAMGIVVSMVYAGSSLGPTVSGFVIDYLGWRWIFFLSFFWILAALLLAILRLKGEWKSAEGEPFDYIGSAIFILALFLIVSGASHVTDIAWAKWILLLGILFLASFIIIEWKASYPLLDIRLLLGNLEFTFSNLSTFLNYAAIFSFIFFFSLYLQFVKGMSAKHAGLIIIVQPVVQALLAPVVGRISDRFPPAIIATIGMSFCTLGLFAAAFINVTTPLTYIFFILLLLGISLGLFSTPNMIVIMSSVAPKYLGTASAMVSTMRTTGMLFSATAVAVFLSIYLGDAPITKENVPQFLSCTRNSLYFFSALSLAGTIFSIVKGRISQRITIKTQIS